MFGIMGKIRQLRKTELLEDVNTLSLSLIWPDNETALPKKTMKADVHIISKFASGLRGGILWKYDIIEDWHGGEFSDYIPLTLWGKKIIIKKKCPYKRIRENDKVRHRWKDFKRKWTIVRSSVNAENIPPPHIMAERYMMCGAGREG